MSNEEGLNNLVNKLLEFYNGGNSDKVREIAVRLEDEFKRAISKRKINIKAIDYFEKGAINAYHIVDDYNSIEKIIKMASEKNIPAPPKPTDQSDEGAQKVSRIIDKYYAKKGYAPPKVSLRKRAKKT